MLYICLFVYYRMYSFECCLHILSNVQKFPFPKQPEIIKKGSWKGHYTESINTLEAYSQRKMTLYFDDYHYNTGPLLPFKDNSSPLPF